MNFSYLLVCPKEMQNKQKIFKSHMILWHQKNKQDYVEYIKRLSTLK